MSSKEAVSENIDILFSKLEKFLKSEAVVGQPIIIGETTIIPIVTITFGCGTGTGAGKDGKGTDGSGTGLGVGARIIPNAVLVIKASEVTMLSVKGKNNLSNLIEMVPDIISKLNINNNRKNDKDNKEHNNFSNEQRSGHENTPQNNNENNNQRHTQDNTQQNYSPNYQSGFSQDNQSNYQGI